MNLVQGLHGMGQDIRERLIGVRQSSFLQL